MNVAFVNLKIPNEFKPMFYQALALFAFLALLYTLWLQTKMLTEIMKKGEEKKQALHKKKWKFPEVLVPRHLVKKVEEEEKKESAVKPLAILETEKMSYDDKNILLAALAEEDTNI